jgi:hypothetical protein
MNVWCPFVLHTLPARQEDGQLRCVSSTTASTTVREPGAFRDACQASTGQFSGLGRNYMRPNTVWHSRIVRKPRVSQCTNSLGQSGARRRRALDQCCR